MLLLLWTFGAAFAAPLSAKSCTENAGEKCAAHSAASQRRVMDDDLEDVSLEHISLLQLTERVGFATSAKCRGWCGRHRTPWYQKCEWKACEGCQPCSTAAAKWPELAQVLPVNPRYFAFSSYLGSIVNLSYSDSAVMRVANTMRLGSVRYPGGRPANFWNMSSGRYISYIKDWGMAKRNMKVPEGTFTPAKYMEGFGGSALASPLWVLNVATITDKWLAGNIANPPAQVDTLKQMGVPVESLEMDNEHAIHDLPRYLESAKSVATRAKEVFPDTNISVIGCFGLDWTSCSAELKRQYESEQWFDGVSLHGYGPNNATVEAQPTDLLQRTITLAHSMQWMAHSEWLVASSISPNVQVMATEINWGGDWSGRMWPEEMHGALRGLKWASYVLSAIDVSESAKSAGRQGVGGLWWYSLFKQDENGWTYWSSCAHVSNQANLPDQVAFDGVAQIFTHVTHVALWSGFTHVKPLRAVSRETVPIASYTHQRCVLAAHFSNADGVSDAIVVLNTCPTKLTASFPAGPTGSLSVVTYTGTEVGGWIRADNIQSLNSPPWKDGPLTPVLSSSLPVDLEPVSLYIIVRGMATSGVTVEGGD